MVCRYTVTAADGRKLTLVGKKGLSEYLANGGLEHLLPERAASLRRTPISKAVANIGRPERLQQVEREAADLIAGWENSPNVIVVSGMEDPRIPDAIRAADKKQRDGGAVGEPEGFFYRGTAYLFAPQLPNVMDVARVIFHEGLGHYGLRGVFGDSLKPVLEQIVALRKADVLAKAKSYGLDKDNPVHLLEAAEEVLADMAERVPNIGYVQRAIAAIRTWLRQNVPGFSKLELSDAEIIRDYILPARAFVQRGAQAGRDMADAVASRKEHKSDTIEVDGVMRPTTNSEGRRIALTEEGLRNFWRWFGDSKVVDAEGKPLVVYHGTTADFYVFNTDGYRDLGSHFGDAAQANDFAEFDDGRVIPVFLRITNPLEMPDLERWTFERLRDYLSNIGIDVPDVKRELVSHRADENAQNHYSRQYEAVKSALEEAGYDGIIYTNKHEGNGGRAYIAFRPEQIKSATGNNGDFDASNPDILASRDSRFDSKEDIAEAKRVEEAIAGKSLSEAANWLADDLKELAAKKIAERVADTIQRLEKQGARFSLNVVSVTDQAPRPLTEFVRGHTIYSLKNDGTLDVGVWLNGSDVDGRIGTSKSVLLHELVHAVTAAAIDIGNQPAMRGTKIGEVAHELKDAFNVMRDHLRNKKNPTRFESLLLSQANNAGENVHEMLAWAMTDRDMQKTLESIPYEGGTAWSKFVNAIRRLLGLSTDSEGMLSSVLQQFDNLTSGDFMEVYGEFANRMENNRGSFSRGLNVQDGQSLVLPEQGMLRRVQAAMQDSFNRVKQVQERIQEKTGKTLAESANYYMAEANRPGRIAARKEDFERSIIQPLMEKLAKSGFKPEQLAELLHAMHAEERNESRGKLHPEDSDYYRAMTEHDIVGASGMSTNKAKEIIAKYKGARELHKLANDARQITKMTLDLQLASNRISKEDYDALNDAYEFYVPLKGDGEYGPTIKRAIGHGERDEFILENIKRDYELAVVAGEKNLARMPFLRMVLENPDENLWSVGVPPKGRYIAGTVFSIRKGGVEEAAFTSQAQVSAFLEAKGSAAGQYEVFAGNEKVKEFTKPLQDNEVMVYLDGQPVRIQINGDEQLARQLRPLDRGQMNVILEQMRSLNRWLSKVYTGYNPAFIIRNTVRDALTGTINIVGNEGAGTAAKAWANYPGALKAMGQYAATGKAPDSEMGKYLNEYRMHGGKTGASWLSDLEAQGADLQRMFDDAYGASGYLKDGKTGKAAWIAGRKIVGGMAHVIEVMNQATENSLRLALYVAMRKQGKSAGEAAQAAKSVTVDFDRKGSMTGAMGAIYLFFNPAVQGTANAIKTLAKGRHKEQAWAALGALALLGMYAAGSGMDDDKDRWLGEGWESRSKNFIMNIGGNHIKLPVSMEFAPFYGFGVALAEAMRGESKMSSAVRMMSSVIDAYFPLNGVFSPESDNHAMDAAMAMVPTALKPGLEIAANRNSFGSQVYPENEYTKDRPDNQKMFRGTKGSAYDAAAQGIAKAGEAIGFGRYENDITKVSPETLKMLWRTYTGGLGQFVTDAAGLASLSSQGATELSDVPIVKDFVKPNDVKAIRGRFYDLAKDVRAAASEFSIAKKAGDGEAMDAILSRPEKAELLGLDGVIKKTQRATAALRDEMVDVSSDQTLSTAQKRARLKELEAVEEDMYRAAIGAFK